MASKNYYEGKTDVGRINEENNRKIELTFISDFEDRMLGLVKKWEQSLPKEDLLPRRFLQEALKKARKQYPELNIGYTRMSIIKYENEGIIQKPKGAMDISGHGDW